MRLIIDNSECAIEGLSIAQHAQLKELMSYTIGKDYYQDAGPRKIPLLNKKGGFPTGLLYIAEQYLLDNNLLVDRNDIRRVPKHQEGIFKLASTAAPYPEQKAAVEAAKRFKRGIISAPTGTGKSYIITLLIEALQVPTLVVVPNLELKRQLHDSLVRSFGADKVGFNKPIMVQNIDSLESSKHTQHYDCVIIDEFHHSASKTYRKLNKTAWARTYYKFGFTATPFRSQDEERLLLESVLSKVIYRISYNQAVEKGYIVPLEAYYIEIPKVKTKASTWAEVYSELVVNNESRNTLLADLLLNLSHNKISTLCLVKEVKHGEILAEKTKGYFAHGNNDDTPLLLQLFNKKKLPVLIGTTGIVGEGLDTKPCEFVIIGGLGKSKNAFMQQVGRAFRRYENKESAKVILILDRSHKFTREHYKSQCQHLLEEYGIIPTKIELNNS